jgi:oxygen-independent coproporphyrinogen-3 oxidase
MAEFMFLGLRLTKGISTRKFEEQFDVAYDTIYGSITQKHINDGLLEKKGENIRLTELGMDVCNVVMSSYILC